MFNSFSGAYRARFRPTQNVQPAKILLAWPISIEMGGRVADGSDNLLFTCRAIENIVFPNVRVSSLTLPHSFCTPVFIPRTMLIGQDLHQRFYALYSSVIPSILLM